MRTSVPCGHVACKTGIFFSILKMHSCHNGALKEEVLQIQHGGSVLHTGTHVPHKNPSLDAMMFSPFAMRCVTHTGIRQAV